MILSIVIPAPKNVYCSTCLISTEYIDLGFDLDPKGTLTCVRCQTKKEPND